MLRDSSFYTIKPASENGSFDIKINPKHPIFKGHFPEKPIVPGVCIVEICREICEEIYHKRLIISKVRNIKFTQILTPTEYPEVRFSIQHEHIENQEIDIQASVKHNDTLFTKIQMTLKYF